MHRAAWAAARPCVAAAAASAPRVAVRAHPRAVAVAQRVNGAVRRMATAAQEGTGGGRRPYGGLEPHLPGPIHVNVAKYLQALMWFWVFYRFKEDGAVLLVRWCGWWM